MFGDDSFMDIEDLFNQLASGGQQSHHTREQIQNLLGTVESKQETILIFDLSGKAITSVGIRDNLETNEYGERINAGQKELTIKFENNEELRYHIPKALSRRKLNHTFSNGILEVSLSK